MGICASSNLGNMDTVCQESEVIFKEHVDKTSPMNLPVASSNVIPASIAIRFGLKAINLMLCNGATSGVDAVHIAAQMIRSGRADKMLVVGVEPLNPVTEKLMRECDPERGNSAALHPGELAACLVLERHDGVAPKRYATIGEYATLQPNDGWTSAFPPPDVWFVPSQRTRRSRELVAQARSGAFAEVPCMDVSKQTGELYGALGVFQVLLASLYLRESGKESALVSNGFSFGDGLSSVQINA